MDIRMAKYLGRLGRSRRSLRRPLAGLDRRSSRVTTGINERNISEEFRGDKWSNFLKVYFSELF